MLFVAVTQRSCSKVEVEAEGLAVLVQSRQPRGSEAGSRSCARQCFQWKQPRGNEAGSWSYRQWLRGSGRQPRGIDVGSWSCAIQWFQGSEGRPRGKDELEGVIARQRTQGSEKFDMRQW